MSKKLISACMITKNEAEYLEYSIKSFIDYVDELIVIDDHSSDGTQDIVRKFGDKAQLVVNGKYDGDKATQRNEYLKRATGEWIFCPDGDEVYHPEDMAWFRDFAEKDRDTWFVGVRLQNFWKDYVHVIHGNVWDSIMQRIYRNLPGVGHYDTHHTVSLSKGKILAREAKALGKALLSRKFLVPHYSYCKQASGIVEKLRYYMKRDNPGANTEEEIEKFVNMHPYLSEDYNHQRYGDGGLHVAGTVQNNVEKVLRVEDVKHPEIMKSHPNWPRLHDYVLGMNKYMETHWQFHNHLTYPKHQTRIKLAGSYCIGRTVEVGCANGFSTKTMQDDNKNAQFHGVEATDWGYAQAKKNYPEIKFWKAYAESLPFKDGEFDTVLLPEIIEHVYDPRLITDEGWRVCKKRMIVTTPTKEHPDPDHKRFFPLDEMLKYLSKYTSKISVDGLDIKGNPTKDRSKIYFMIAIADKE